MVRIGIIGAGRIGGNVAGLFAAAGHEVMLSLPVTAIVLRASPPCSRCARV